MSEQGSPEWFELRRGRATASRFSDVLAGGKELKSRTGYRNQLVVERLTGQVAKSFRNKHTDRGTAQEPLARMAYEAETGYMVERSGFIPHPSLMAGGSPDGLVNSDGGVEIKSVLPLVQFSTIDSGGIPTEHIPQVQGLLWLTDRRWWDFVSYSPTLPENLQLYIHRIYRDEAYIRDLEFKMIVFLLEIGTSVNLRTSWRLQFTVANDFKEEQNEPTGT